MALLFVLLSFSLMPPAESAAFLRGRALSKGPATSLDGSLGWKGSNRAEDTFVQDTDTFVQDTDVFARKEHFVKHTDDLATPFGGVIHSSAPPNASAELFSEPKHFPVMDQDQSSHASTSAAVADNDFEVHTMLLWALREAAGTSGDVHPDFHRQSSTDHLGLEVTKSCVPEMQQMHFVEGFSTGVNMMLQKTLHGMQHGLLQVAHSTVELIQGTNCGLLSHARLEKLSMQADRLGVLASAGSLDDLDVTVKYEPMKALAVGGVDVHVELNALLIAWQFNKGPEEMGRALAAFLRDFNDDSSDELETPSVAQAEDLHESRTPRFWAEVLQTAMMRLGGGEPESIRQTCLSGSVARSYGDALEDGISRMLEKTARGMRAGIQEIATATVAFVDGLEAPCSEVPGAAHLRSAASRVRVFASAKTLIHAAKHVEYEPMKVLKIGGIDVHTELNRFLVAWLHHKGAVELAEGLVDFFQDFKEHEIADAPSSESAVTHSNNAGEHGDSDSSSSEENVEELEVLGILRDSMDPSATGLAREKVLAKACMPDLLAQGFLDHVEKALGFILEKQTSSMQLGLKELAAATDDVFGMMDFMNLGCVSDAAKQMWEGARKLRSLIGKTNVDYGTHVQYEALKGLTVGTVDVHQEINDFVVAWKLQSRREAGVPFGNLMRKFASIRGHDEL